MDVIEVWADFSRWVKAVTVRLAVGTPVRGHLTHSPGHQGHIFLLLGTAEIVRASHVGG